MTSNPYIPDETELRDCYAGLSEEYAGEDYATAKADAERGIAKIKADAWTAAVDYVRDREFQDATAFRMNKRNPYREQEASNDH